MISISVIIPTFNRAHLLERALQSVRRQTMQPQEIIVIDDGSQDQTGGLVCDHYPDVRYVWQENRGVSAARNHGIRLAGCEWLAFLDSDDEWLPEKLACQAAALKEQPGFLLCHTNEIWIRNGRRVNPMIKHTKHGGFIFQKCLSLCLISPSATLLHRSLIEEAGPFDESLPACEDDDLWLRICSRRPVLYLEDPLIVKYGGHGDQLSQRHWGMDRFRIRALEKLWEADHLTAGDREALRLMLVEKLTIYVEGARKRGKSAESKALGARLAHFQSIGSKG